MAKIQGIIPALVTPFGSGGEFNAEVFRDIIQFHLSTGVDGFYVTGGTGEGLLLDPDERRRILEVAIDEVAGQVPVIAHVGAVATHTAADLAAPQGALHVCRRISVVSLLEVLDECVEG